MRLAGVSKRQDGYVKNYDFGCLNPPGPAVNPADGGVMPIKAAGGDCMLGRYGDTDFEAARAQLRYHPDGPLEINLAADCTHQNQSAPAAVLIAADNPAPGAVRGSSFNIPYDDRFICGDFCSYATGRAPADPDNGIPFGSTTDPHSRYEGYGVSGQVDLDLSDTVSLTSITAYRHYDTDFSNDDDLSPLPVSSSSSTWGSISSARSFASTDRWPTRPCITRWAATTAARRPCSPRCWTAAGPACNSPAWATWFRPIPRLCSAMSWNLTDRLTLNGGAQIHRRRQGLYIFPAQSGRLESALPGWPSKTSVF